jgi:hypothetical protein
MAYLLRIGSFYGLSIWVAVCAVISMGLVYLQMDGHPLVRGVVLILASMVSSVVWAPRPQIMSLALLALVSWFLFAYREKNKWIYLAGIPLIFGLWGNLHGGYVLGLIYLCAYVSGEILDKILFRDTQPRLSWKQIGLVMGTIILGLILVLVNPFGLEMWKIPFNTIGIETLQNLINEWSSPDFHQAFQQPFLWMLLGLFGLMGINGKPVKGNRLVPIVVFAWAALVARRNFGPFAIVSAPALSGSLNTLLQTVISKARQTLPGVEKFLQSADESKKSFNVTARNIINATLIGLLIVACVMKTIQVSQPTPVSEAEGELFPAGAVSWIKEQDLQGKIFNDYNWGGYLIYNLPEAPVFVDGRTDLYGDEILNDYLEVIFCKEDWQETLDKHGLEVLVIRSDSCLKGLALGEGWKVLYLDEKSVVMGSGGGTW